MDDTFKSLFKDLRDEFKEVSEEKLEMKLLEYEYMKKDYEQVRVHEHLMSYIQCCGYCGHIFDDAELETISKILLEGEKRKFLPSLSSCGYGRWEQFFNIDGPFLYTDSIFQGPVGNDGELPHQIELFNYKTIYKYMKMILNNFPNKVTSEMKSTILTKINETLEELGGFEDCSEYVDIFKQMKDLFEE